jgi:hypothetical protein
MYSILSFDSRLEALRRRLRAEKIFRINEHGKIVLADPGRAWDMPWIVIGNPRRKFCYHWNHVYCGMMNLIPRFCRFNCWKVVAKPRNIKETLLLHGSMKTLDLPSKVGMDLRPYTFGAWAAFFYADSLDQAKTYYLIVRPEIAKIAPEIPVIVKRGCTEMEAIRPSKTWDTWTDEEQRLEAALDDLFEFEELPFTESAWMRNDIMERWIKHAISIGDPTAREMAEAMSCDPDIWRRLVVTADTYHEDIASEWSEPCSPSA